ncbi:MAG: SH3 domain-containing protein [Lachnospiraceae bacterium]|nr:SH3 domain-containing protein [Lachnospiraceae bacterium]
MENGSFNIDSIKEFFAHNMRQAISVAVVAGLVVVMGVTAGKGNSTVAEQTETTEVATEAVTETEVSTEFKVDEYPAVNELINNYYSAYANGDTDTLASIAPPLSDMEKSYIAMFSEYVESYQNIVCYTKQGMESDSYVVSVSLEIKLKDADTTAPGLDFFYIRTNEDGSLYIDNVYSQFNLSNQQVEIDKDVLNFINAFEEQDDSVALQESIQTAFNDALSNDENLNTLVTSTIPAAITNWSAEMAEQAKQAEAEQKAAEEAAAAAEAEQKAAEEAQAALAEKYANAVTVYVTEKINVRESASTDSAIIGQLTAGSTTTLLEARDDGWAEIDYSEGVIGYVKQEYLTTDASGTATTATDTTAETTTDETAAATDANGLAEGTVITIQTSTNLRESMDSNSTKLATIFQGEKVTVIMSYAEGWTKVSYGDKTGYIKTDLLR